MDRNNNTQQEFSKKYFTIEEAEILLPKIEKILRRTIQKVLLFFIFIYFEFEFDFD